MNTETKTEIISKKEELEIRNKMRAELVEKLTAKIDAKQKELETKKYIIEGGVAAGETIGRFLTEKAQWKFSEALGIMESVSQVETAVDAINKGKAKELFVPALALEAVYYFLTKVEGAGLEEAKEYVNILKPISDALGRSKQDRTELDQLTRDRGTLESAIDSGIDLENEDDILKEIQEELLND
jgi:hypothetical protein